MTEAEKMEAMKRAYAEMILNTAKEAAARVMAAELRATRMEQEVANTKEEAAGMLLRLKQMIDAKTKEAEIESLNQQRKYDELESQLNEAEEIILDLRAELNQTQEQVDVLRNEKLYAKRQNEENAEELYVNPKGSRSVYELLTPFLNSQPEFSIDGGDNLLLDSSTVDRKCFSPAKHSASSNFECDQMKEPERFRNGCTERICATETSLAQEKVPVGEKPNASKNSTDIEIVNGATSNSVLEEKVQRGKNDAVSIVRRSIRKRKLKFWDDVIAACGIRRPYQLKKPRQTFSHLSCFSTSKIKRCVKFGEDQAEDGPKLERLDHAEVPKEAVHTEALPENVELIDVLVKPDELAAASELTSASRIDCDVEDGSATKSSNLSYANGKRLCKYKVNRKWKKKSMIYPEKSS